MKIEVRGIPEFTIPMTAALAKALKAACLLHYSPECKEAGSPGGFVFGWVNRVTVLEECDDPKLRAAPSVTARFRDLDIVGKTLEMARHHPDAAERKLLEDFRAEVDAILRSVSADPRERVVPEWNCQLETFGIAPFKQVRLVPGPA